MIFLGLNYRILYAMPTDRAITPPPSPTHTSTIPYTHLHYLLHTPPPSPTPPPSRTHTSTIPYTHLHYPIHTLPPFVCLPAVYIAPITTRHPVRATPKNVLLQKRFAPNPTYALRQIRHTLCAKSDICFAPNPTYALRDVRFARNPSYVLRDLVLRQIALMSNVLVRELPGHRIQSLTS